jgi:hypothetical protein
MDMTKPLAPWEILLIRGQLYGALIGISLGLIVWVVQ